MREKIRKTIVWGLAVLSFLAPLKFTQIAVLSNLTPHPSGWADWILGPWPNSIFYGILAGLVVLRVLMGKGRALGFRVWMGPGLFLAVQCLATFFSTDPLAGRSILALFLGLAIGYVLAADVIRDARDVEWIAFGWLVAGILVAASGIFQATGGLEKVQQNLHAHPELLASQPDLARWATSERIYATFVYPNALGGYAISAGFVIVAWCLSFGRLMAPSRGNGAPPSVSFKDRALPWLVGGLTLAALVYCLWRSGSRSSGLVFLLVVSMATAWWFRRRRLAGMVLAVILLVFAGGIGLWLSPRAGGPSAVAKGRRAIELRLGIWRAAWKIGWEHPGLGSGPGTFGAQSSRHWRPTDDRTILVHNNYLQMWSDSGLAGFVALVLWLPGTLVFWWWRWRGNRSASRAIPILLACACLCFALRSLVDFDLYMPGNAWPIFVWLGYLSRSAPEDTNHLHNPESR